MNKNIINFIATIIIAYVLSLFMGWYSVMIASIITAFLIPLKRFTVFLVPFLAIFILWVVLSYLMGSSNDFILGERIADLLSLNGNVYLLLIITGLVGGIASGVAAIFGKQLSVLNTKA
ncbi:hypothetical protein [Winogradskyella sp. A2]|uniref:hypothetical protein n=1 Tax=Winogradskyella sp. A2 TaxID=3366944 RepID=UPI00398C4C14